LRIDHLLLNAELAPALKAAGVDAWVRGEEGASDHAPTWIELDLSALGKKPATAKAKAPAKKAAAAKKMPARKTPAKKAAGR
jgi:exodeoxyribonuclease-3